MRGTNFDHKLGVYNEAQRNVIDTHYKENEDPNSLYQPMIVAVEFTSYRHSTNFSATIFDIIDCNRKVS